MIIHKMHRRLLSTAYLVVSALRVILAQDFNPESLLPQHKSPLLGDICKSLRTACDITEFPASIEVWYIAMHQLSTWLTLREKLCDEYCESEIAASDLKGRLCKNFRKVYARQLYFHHITTSLTRSSISKALENAPKMPEIRSRSSARTSAGVPKTTIAI